jgi:hypothetical protein
MLMLMSSILVLTRFHFHFRLSCVDNRELWTHLDQRQFECCSRITWLYKYSNLTYFSRSSNRACSRHRQLLVVFSLEYLPSHPRLVEEPGSASPCSQEEFMLNSTLQATLELSEKYSKLHEFRVSWAYDTSAKDHNADPCYFRVSEMTRKWPVFGTLYTNRPRCPLLLNSFQGRGYAQEQHLTWKMAQDAKFWPTTPGKKLRDQYTDLYKIAVGIFAHPCLQSCSVGKLDILNSRVRFQIWTLLHPSPLVIASLNNPSTV